MLRLLTRRQWLSPKKGVCLLMATSALYWLGLIWYRPEIASLAEHAIVAGSGVLGGLLGLGDVYGEDGVEPENAALLNDTYTFNQTEEKGASDLEIRIAFEEEYEEAGRRPHAGSIYGGTVSSLVLSPARQTNDGTLSEWNATASFTNKKPFKFNPYPDYNSPAWKRSGRARYVPCQGPMGQSVQDISTYVGLPKDFPEPSFGSYDVFDLDAHLCFERDTRLGLYALPPKTRDNVNWGTLQLECVEQNEARFDSFGPLNDQAMSVYGLTEETREPKKMAKSKRWAPREKRAVGLSRSDRPSWWSRWRSESGRAEARTAILLRSYTGKAYTENDRYSIRSLVMELSLRTGGEYQVFLLVHVKEAGVNLWDDEVYERYLDTSVPEEFRDITLLWNDETVQDMYPLLDKNSEATVHNAQWLSVQKFMQEFRQFSFVWNWEMDARVLGQAYDMLTKLGEFAKRQPRRGLWERNERFYIPDYHGSYDTSFRRQVWAQTKNDTVWGAPDLPFIRPIGPPPPTALPQDDRYQWGVGEEADLLTLSPLFDPQGSGWVLWDQVWAYADAEHASETLPRRASIVTQCRLSRRLVDIMHVENLRGNHVGSEMAPATVAFLHGLKAVYAPMPVFMDRPWSPRQRARWFNGGPRGSSGGPTSAMGWGREGRFRGTTWYYRAEPPQRLYNNWAGYEDGGIGGVEWEMANGRPCLPALFLHPVKDVVPTGPGFQSESKLPYA